MELVLIFTGNQNEIISRNPYRVSVLWLLLLAAWITLLASNISATEISARPYPVDGLRVVREDITSGSFRLSVTNLNLAPPNENRSISKTWLIAGARGRVPTFVIESANFVLMENDKEISRSTNVPDSIKQNIVRLSDLGLFRQYWTYNLTLLTATPSGQDRFWMLKDIVIKFDLGEAGSPLDGKLASRWKPDFGEETLLGSQLINPQLDPAYYATDYNDPVDSWIAWSERVKQASASGNMFRFRVYEGGIYRIDRGVLDPQTSDSILTATSRWRVYNNGQEVAVFSVPGISDALFLPVAIEANDGLRHETYWVDTSGANTGGGNPLRLEKSEAISANTADLISTGGQFSLLSREFNEFVPSHNATPGMDRWFWTELNNRLPSKMELVLPEHFQPASDSNVEVSFRYSYTNYPPIQPKMQVYVGGREAGETSLTLHQGIGTVSIAADALKAGTNHLALTLVYPSVADSLRPVSIQSIEAKWTQQIPSADSSLVVFNELDGVSTGVRALQFPNDISPTEAVIGFRNAVPSLLHSSGNTAIVEGEPLTAIYYVDCKEATKTPKVRRVAASFSLSEMRSAQSVIISASELTSGSKRLKQQQEARGLSVAVYSVDDLYDAFSFGNATAAGVRNALRYLFNRAPGDVPEYITLVGEASDFRGDPSRVPEGTQFDMVPPSTAMTPNAPQGDNLYSAAIGSDMIGDLIVGRIPAPDSAALNGYLDKIEAFEKAPVGDWARQAQFAMDDNDEFPDVVSHILEHGVAPGIKTGKLQQWDYEYVPNLRVQGVKRSWGATERILEVFNQGVGILNFFGHGGPNLWSHERMLHLSDLPKIQNGSMLPLITCASCDSAWISYPTLPVKASMGEKLVLKADGGAVGLFGPVAGASPYEHETLVQSLMEALSRVQLRRAGDLTFYAKNQYYAITRSASIVDQYLLLGDPTIGLRTPKIETGLSVDVTPLLDGSSQVLIKLSTDKALTAGGTLTFSGSGNETPVQLAFSAGITQWMVQSPSSFAGHSVMALLESSTESGPVLVGEMFSLGTRKNDPVSPEIKSVVGAAYSIWPDADNAVAGSPSARVFRYGIKAADGATTSVRVVASLDGKAIGEAQRVEIPNKISGAIFDINSSIALEPPVTTLTLEVYPLQTSATVAETTVTITYPEAIAADLELIPETARAYSKTGEFVANATVFLEAELRNNGKTEAKNILLQAFKDSPTTGTELKTINDMSSMRGGDLKPGESKKVTFRWEYPTLNEQPAIYLVVNKSKVIRELNYDNNSVHIPTFTVQHIGNYTVPEFEVSPRYAAPGTTVTVHAVLQHEGPDHNRPVTVEVGWNRNFDGETTSTRMPVHFVDGWATVTHELIASPDFNRAFINVNADLENEESDPGDNVKKSENMAVIALPPLDVNQPWQLSNTLLLGTAYNLVSPMPGVLRVAPRFTSTTELLLMDMTNVTTGSATVQQSATDNAWSVAQWRVVAEPGEDPGAIGFRLPIPGLKHDLSGLLSGYVVKQGNVTPTIDVRNEEGSEWNRVSASRVYGDKVVADIGYLNMMDRNVHWQMKQSDPKQGFRMEYLTFHPEALDWESPPYMMPPESINKLLGITMNTDDLGAWTSFWIEWRTGTSAGTGGIDWTNWSSAQNAWDVSIRCEQYIQIRVIGVPVKGKKPYLDNFRLTLK